MIILIFAILACVNGIRHACLNQNIYINCHQAGFTELPLIETTITEADFSDNQISTLLITYKNIEIFDISGNNIKILNWTGDSLTHLNISRNPLWKIVYLNAPNLEQLDISKCGLNYLNDDFFMNVPNLIELYASDNPLKYIAENPLHILYVNNARLKNIPYMPQLHTLEINNNPFINQIKTTNSYRILKASNCKISQIELNVALRYLDISKNSVTNIKLNTELEVLHSSWNLLRYIDLNEMIRIVDLSNNLLNKITVKSPYLEEINLSKNPIQELNILCNLCQLDCSYCQVKKYNFYKVKFLNLSYNNIEKIQLENVKNVDLRHNLIQEFKSDDIEIFDLRHNIMSDVNKLNVNGIGYYSENPWPCNCETIKKIVTKSKDKLCEGNAIVEKCLRSSKKSNVHPVIIGFSVMISCILFIFVLRIKLNVHPIQEEVIPPRDDLPSYEQALTMAKPDWTESQE